MQNLHLQLTTYVLHCILYNVMTIVIIVKSHVTQVAFFKKN